MGMGAMIGAIGWNDGYRSDGEGALDGFEGSVGMRARCRSDRRTFGGAEAEGESCRVEGTISGDMKRWLAMDGICGAGLLGGGKGVVTITLPWR